MLSFVERTQSHDRSAQSLLAPPPPNLPHSDQQTIPKLAIAVEQPVGALFIPPATERHNKHHQTPVQPTGESHVRFGHAGLAFVRGLVLCPSAVPL